MLVVAAVFVTGLVKAQRFDGGILAGFNGAQVEGDTYKGYNKPGAVAGFYVQTDLAPAIFAALWKNSICRGVEEGKWAQIAPSWMIRN